MEEGYPREKDQASSSSPGKRFRYYLFPPFSKNSLFGWNY
jgi:hypothetical protein